jgi:hypothetical protein
VVLESLAVPNPSLAVPEPSLAVSASLAVPKPSLDVPRGGSSPSFREEDSGSNVQRLVLELRNDYNTTAHRDTETQRHTERVSPLFTITS